MPPDDGRVGSARPQPHQVLAMVAPAALSGRTIRENPEISGNGPHMRRLLEASLEIVLHVEAKEEVFFIICFP